MKRHQDREKSSKLPDPLRSKAEEVWSGNETRIIEDPNKQGPDNRGCTVSMFKFCE